jgi:hypothetical protein
MSTKAKHTKYKVVFEKNETRPCKMYISSGNRNLVASVNNDPETVAMFQLFAAAPEMLEALEALLESAIQAEHFEHNSYNPPTEIHEMMANGDFSKRIFNAIAAIAKAKGEQP